MNTELGLVAKKIGMTQYFLEDGTRVPVTVLEAKGNLVIGHRTEERDGYTALRIGFTDRKASRMNKPDLGQFKAGELAAKHKIVEFRVPADKLEAHPVGSEISLEAFEEGNLVDVTGTSKGKGFQGVMKRHGMRGEKRTHGNHETFRHGGSIGCRLTPGRVLKGKRMPGQMGNERVTVQNLQIARIIADKGLILVRGPIPGSNDSYVTVRGSVKAAIRNRHGKK